MSGDLVPYQHRGSITLAPEAWTLAQRIAQTPFVPKDLRGKPESVLAAILTGDELGIGAMQALSKIHVIEGRPSIAAELMRALVLREGHDLWVEELSNTRCTVVVQRAGSERQQRFTWTIDDAKAAGLTGKDNWRKYPRAMLMARATGEACRIVFPDLLAGMSYTTEELTDGEGVDVEDLKAAAASPATPAPAKRTARARKAVTRPAAPPAEAAPTAKAEAPPLPGEDDGFDPTASNADDDQGDDVDDVEDAEIVEDEYEGPDEHHAPRTYSGVQLIAMKLSDLGVTERPARLRLIGSIVGREIASSKDLTDPEIRSVLDKLNESGYQPDLDASPPAAPAHSGDRPVRRRRAAPPGEEPFEETPRPPAPPSPPPPAAPSPRPDQWTGDHWRDFLADRGVKAMELLKEAAKLAREQEQRAPGTLDDVAGSGLADLLVGYVEDLALERSCS